MPEEEDVEDSDNTMIIPVSKEIQLYKRSGNNSNSLRSTY